ncbi:MAG: hypothetical protein KDB00_15630 [Planctomycetales bacterium]|nr:hypothetical protein [Planctomycetales bacterium]
MAAADSIPWGGTNRVFVKHPELGSTAVQIESIPATIEITLDDAPRQVDQPDQSTPQ